MINIDYALSSTQLKIRDLAEMDIASLRYRALIGDIVLNVNGQDFSARWGWVPILDFDLSLLQIQKELKESPDAMCLFEFTESEATLSFARDGDQVVIGASYSPLWPEYRSRNSSRQFDRFTVNYSRTFRKDSLNCWRTGVSWGPFRPMTG